MHKINFNTTRMKNKFKIKKVFLNYNTIKYQIKGIIY